jgi:uncharacterized protein YfaS (alpha-2-macroglobulin family)
MLASGLLAGPRDEQWKKVEEARRNGLPKTAIEALAPIIQGATADKANAEAIKAIALKIALESEIQGNKPEERILRMQAELEKAPPPMKPAMEAILAHWYWQYFQQNRWRFMQRTQTAAASGQDPETWDLVRILAEIDKHFTAALADEKTLKATPIGEYNDLFEPASGVDDRYRPTMFDFLAYEALGYYQAGEQGAIKDEDAFELEAGSPIFADPAEFSNWQPASTDEASPILKAIRLYQGLLKFHEADADRSAYYDADLSRLSYGWNVAIGEGKAERYKAALERFISATAKHESSALALAEMASLLDDEGEPAKAHEVAQRGLDAFPASAGGAMCFNLIQKIEAKSAQLDTERVWNEPWPTLNVEYRNVTKVYFRAVRVDFDDYVAKARWSLGGVSENEREKLLSTAPEFAWSADLPPTKDYRQRTEKLPAPTTLRPGFYFIFASHDPSFGEGKNQVSYAAVWVSNLALVLRIGSDFTTRGGFVLRANSGEPVAGATVRIWQCDDAGLFSAVDRTKTDENGRFQLPSNNKGLLVLAEFDGQAVASEYPLFPRNRIIDDRADSQTVFFTDRAIYRPGQTIDYKGITVRNDHAAGKYSVVAGRAITVVFSDPNGTEIARATHETNDYGSFSGTFTAPRDRVTGLMTIQVLGLPKTSTEIRIEEYKRPKFQVEIDPPGEAAKLAAPVVLTGKATAYTGAAVGGAKVKWRVERDIVLPYWCWWWQPPAAQAIAHGTVITALDGTFEVQFPAEPDRSVPAENEPIFVFTLHIDVTDTTGETRSDERSVRAGYTALKASLTADDWQTPDKPVAMAVETTSLDGEAQSARGTVTIYALQQPRKVERTPLQPLPWKSGAIRPKNDPSDPDSWEVGKTVSTQTFNTDAKGKAQVATRLKAGIYRASLETADRFGKKATARLTVQVVDPGDRHYRVKLPNLVSAPKWSVEPGEKFVALWGTGYDKGRAFVELECDRKPLKSYWTAANRTQELIELPVTEDMRGGVTMRVTFVRENRAYITQNIVEVPWSNKDLTVKWERFRSKLTPGQKETWTAIVTGPDSRRAAAEVVASLYDASLDQYAPQRWPQEFPVFRQESNREWDDFQNTSRFFGNVYNWESPSVRPLNWSYRAFTDDVGADDDWETVKLTPFGVSTGRAGGYTPSGTRLAAIPNQITVIDKEQMGNVNSQNTNDIMMYEAGIEGPAGQIGSQSRRIGDAHAEALREPDLARIAARKNLNETAFFFPHLLAGDDGVVKIVFTMPEALTEWKFLAFAHDKDLRSGFLTDKIVTAKDLMVEPNPPRFLREGDSVEFAVKVSNQSDGPQTGKVRLTFADAATLRPVDEALGNRSIEQNFNLGPKQSRSYFWRIAVPDGMGFLTYKAVGASALASDGEEGYLPVLSRRILVAESLPLPIRGKTSKQFEFQKLLDSGRSDTLRSQSLTVQMVSQPAWYAVMALPYLMEYPYECSEQIFNRLYANSLARHVANSDPKIRRVFDLWKDTPALDSPLEKNKDLVSVMLEETPWVRQATNESQSRRNVGILFDANRLDEESARALQQLSERQASDGLWPWFPGGRTSEYISLYIATGFGRLRRLGVDVDMTPATKSLDALDAWMADRYSRILKSPNPDGYIPSYTDAFYLYGRSFFLKDRPMTAKCGDSVNFFLGQARKYWLQVGSRQSQAHLAIALQRFGDHETAQAIMNSIKERSVADEELGMFWRDLEPSWWWYRAPIETQAMMIEAFGEVSNDAQAVEACKVWLLKQKQTQSWESTKATADATYALLATGGNLLGSDALVTVALAGETIKPEKVEAGTGFYEQKFVRNEVAPAMGRITVTKTDDGVGWGSIHWQYLEDMSKVTPHEGTPLKLKKTLFVKVTTKKGQVLEPVNGPLSVGDELVVRLELRTDRDMEFVHLKDQRGSGTEPVDVLSGYQFQDGLAYYESTRDTASHFFIDYLPKGVYVFEYSTRVQLKGSFQTGIAEIQCMYAPEFNSHSESFALEAK